MMDADELSAAIDEAHQKSIRDAVEAEKQSHQAVLDAIQGRATNAKRDGFDAVMVTLHEWVEVMREATTRYGWWNEPTTTIPQRLVTSTPYGPIEVRIQA